MTLISASVRLKEDMVVVMEMAAAYSRARLAQAKVLCHQGRYDECFKLLAASKKQLRRWGWGRYPLFLQFLIGECELGLAASRAGSKYYDDARKIYFEHNLQLGVGSQYHFTAELHERWQKLGEKFGRSQPKVTETVDLSTPPCAVKSPPLSP